MSSRDRRSFLTATLAGVGILAVAAAWRHARAQGATPQDTTRVRIRLSRFELYGTDASGQIRVVGALLPQPIDVIDGDQVRVTIGKVTTTIPIPRRGA